MAYRREETAGLNRKYKEKRKNPENSNTERRGNEKRSNCIEAEEVKKNIKGRKKYIGCPIYEKCGGCLGQEEPY